MRPFSRARRKAHAGADEEQGQQRVGVVVAEDQDGGRREGHDEAGDDGRRPDRTAGGRPRTAAPPSRRPSSASGRRMLHELSPNSRTERPISIVASGGLSTVMKFAGSSEPKNQADQLCEAASAARRVVGVGVAADRQVDEVEDRRERQHAELARAGPRRRPRSTADQADGRPRRAGGRRRSGEARVRGGSGDGGHDWLLFEGGDGSRTAERGRGAIHERRRRNRATVASALATTRTASSTSRPASGATSAEQRDGARGDGERDAEGDEAGGLVADERRPATDAERQAPVGGRVADRRDDERDAHWRRRPSTTATQERVEGRRRPAC